jgi:glycosyltransferase involved in cell wall biosynthesis
VKVRFLYVGQIIARKGLIYLLQAINRLPRNLKRMIHFDIVGSGNQLKELQMFKKENELDCVFFRGEVEYNQISRYYKDADCFILNTLHDYRALVGFEALFNGCAIIASEFDGARNEIVHEGYNGFIVNPFDVEAIKRTFLTILDNRENLINFKEYSLLLSLNYSREKSEFAMISVIKELI